MKCTGRYSSTPIRMSSTRMVNLAYIRAIQIFVKTGSRHSYLHPARARIYGRKQLQKKKDTPRTKLVHIKSASSRILAQYARTKGIKGSEKQGPRAVYRRTWELATSHDHDMEALCTIRTRYRAYPDPEPGTKVPGKKTDAKKGTGTSRRYFSSQISIIEIFHTYARTNGMKGAKTKDQRLSVAGRGSYEP